MMTKVSREARDFRTLLAATSDRYDVDMLPQSEHRKRNLAIVASVSFLLLILGIRNIPDQFEDEHYYVEAARDFIAGAPSSNTMHPPLAKYFIAASMKLLGDNPIGWRLPSVLSGTLLAFAIFGMTRRLTSDTRTAYLAWLLTIAGGFWYGMSRVAMLSVYELAFEMAAVWVFLVALETDNATAWCGAGLLFGLSVACRWFGAMGLITCLGVAFSGRRLLKPCGMSFTVFITYCVTWIPLLIREHRPVSYLIDANLFIYRFHRAPPLVGDPGDNWWTWLMPLSPPRSALYVANPIIGACGLFALAAILLGKRRFALVGWLYLANMLPWMIAVKPITYYYYYFEAYVFLAVALAVVTARVMVYRARLDFVVAAAAVGYFVYWFPVWGHFPPPLGGVFGYH